MEDVRKQDPCFTNFVPKTAVEAVDRYVRCRKNGLKPMLVPECLIKCAGGLSGYEMDKFEDWIINPNQDLYKAALVPDDTIRAQNEKTYEEILCRHLKNAPTDTPPLPMELESSQDDEKMIEVEPIQEEYELEKLCLSHAIQ